MKKLIVASLFTTVCTISGLYSQNTELGIFGGISLYSGDVSPREVGLYFSEIHPSYGIFGRYNLKRFVSFRLGLSQARVSGSDANTNYPERLRNFRTDITEAAFSVEISPFRAGGDRAKVSAAPYFFGGAAIYRFNPQTLFENNWIDLQPLGTEGQGLAGYEAPYRLTQVAFPLGLGLKFTFNQAWTLGFEFGARKLLNDYLDDITKTEVNYLDVLTGNGTLAATLSNPAVKEPQDITYKRGGPFMDWYYLSGATLSFRFNSGKNRPGRGLGCPNF